MEDMARHASEMSKPPDEFTSGQQPGDASAPRLAESETLAAEVAAQLYRSGADLARAKTALEVVLARHDLPDRDADLTEAVERSMAHLEAARTRTMQTLRTMGRGEWSEENPDRPAQSGADAEGAEFDAKTADFLKTDQSDLMDTINLKDLAHLDRRSRWSRRL